MSVLIVLLLEVSPVIITEVMSNVRGSETGAGSPGDRNEYVEIYNISSDTVDLAEYWITDFDANDALCCWSDSSLLIKNPGITINSTYLYPGHYGVILDSEYTDLDTNGGYVQPYTFPESTLILTTQNTTIGNGLTGNDPIMLYSQTAPCSTTFGTPFDSFDYFPYDPGDGISWERIDLDLPDTVSNWHTCMDSSGGTPGRANSTINAFDLALAYESIGFQPAVLEAGDDVRFIVPVKNIGLHETDAYALQIYDDANKDSILSNNELLVELAGIIICAAESTIFSYDYQHPDQGMHIMGFQVDFPNDRDLSNNLVLKELRVIGRVGQLALSPAIFTPNNDGIEDRLQIDFRLPDQGGSLDLAVFDSRGRLLEFLCRNDYCADMKGSLYWDGRVAGKEMPTGMYIIYLEYRLQNSVTKAKKTAVLAR
jgi:gliding motility-associated-like protein